MPSAPPSRTTAGNGRWRFISPRRPTRPRCERRLRSPPARPQPRRCCSSRWRQIDWVAQSLAGLRPVRAGRFLVHGAHDRAGVKPNDIGIEIEAALAFGTGHHGTTRGCLLALDDLAKRRRATRVLDVGTGSGVLAIAAAKLLRARVVAERHRPGRGRGRARQCAAQSRGLRRSPSCAPPALKRAPSRHARPTI